ncbi:MAG: hypothetical protein HFE80_09085 [Clostridiaceae bacterium]|jgi:uncharacterized membrane protein YczE|nr:hypothetical protein [Clostridiaceae bacterium]
MKGLWVLGKKALLLFVGFFVLALASVLLKQANIGLGPWDALHDGISRQTPLTYGQASIAVGLAIVAVDFLCKERLGFGTLLNILVIGTFVDILLAAGWIPKLSGAFLPGLIYGTLGVTLMAVGIWLYISAAMGAGPRDSLMVILARRTGKPVGACRACVEALALLAGWALGGQVGMGTILFTLMGGPIMQLVFRLVKFDVKAVRHQTFRETISFVVRSF